MKYEHSDNKKTFHPLAQGILNQAQLKTGLRRSTRGSVLVEATVALVILSVASLVILKDGER